MAGQGFYRMVMHHRGRLLPYFIALGKWLGVAMIVGPVCGVVGSLFHIGVHHATLLREENPWLLFMLPVLGLIITAVYKLTKTEGQGTNDIIDEVQQGKGISLGLLPAIFMGTVLTHLGGGSSGREGAALQMGGTIGYHTGHLLRLDDRDLRTATMAGMAAFFSALFGTPLTATMFALMVISVGQLQHGAFIPCFAASLVSYAVSLLMGVEPTRFAIVVPGDSLLLLAKVGVLGALCAVVSVIFCNVMHFSEHFFRHHLPSPWLRGAVGGVLIVVLTLLCGTGDYNGAGMEVITRAVEQGNAAPTAFLWKMLFTAVTLAVGFKGGEVVPSFFIGATFGCVVGPLLGLPSGFAAALGLIAVFCGATNCPVASIFLAIELFGSAGLLPFALVCGISFMLSGYNGLYSSQTILYSKLKAQYINVHTNAHHASTPLGDLPKGSVKD